MTARVVIVDDAAELRELVAMVIERRSGGAYQVVGQAGDGRAGVDLVRETLPDIVLLDLAMPVMDGLEALPLIRQAAPRAVVLVISAFPSTTAERSALDAGAHAYLEKTDLVSRLIPQIQELVSPLQPGA